MLTKVKNVNLLGGMEFYCYLCGRKIIRKPKMRLSSQTSAFTKKIMKSAN